MWYLGNCAAKSAQSFAGKQFQMTGRHLMTIQSSMSFNSRDQRATGNRAIEYLSNKLLLLLGTSGGRSVTKPFINDRIGSFAKQFNLAGRCADYHRHPLPIAVEFEHVQ